MKAPHVFYNTPYKGIHDAIYLYIYTPLDILITISFLSFLSFHYIGIRTNIKQNILEIIQTCKNSNISNGTLTIQHRSTRSTHRSGDSLTVIRNQRHRSTLLFIAPLIVPPIFAQKVRILPKSATHAHIVEFVLDARVNN